MKVWEVIGLKEDTTAGTIATVAMPLFTGKKGKAHHKAARKACLLYTSPSPRDRG